jgi:P-type conjugative transfer protein TrbJ
MWHRLVLTLTLSLLGAPSAWAQFAVIDAYTGGQAAITALNSIRSTVQQGIQIANEATMIKQQLEQLAYDAANLTQSPLQMADTLAGLFGQYETLLRQAGGVGFQIEGLGGRIGTVYPVLGQPVTDVQDATRRMATWLQEIRHASLTAMQTQAIIPRLQAQRAHVQLALLESANAPGTLAVIQDTNQILGIIVEQNASHQQTQAASQRVQTALTQMQVQMADQEQQDAQHRVLGLGTMQPVQGLGLPAFR